MSAYKLKVLRFGVGLGWSVSLGWPVSIFAADALVCPATISRTDLMTHESRGWRAEDLSNKPADRSETLSLTEFNVFIGASGLEILYPTFDVTSQEGQASWAYYKLNGHAEWTAACIYGRYDPAIGTPPVRLTRALNGADFCVATVSPTAGGSIAATCD